MPEAHAPIRLAVSFEHDREAYSDGKGEFVDRIMAGACPGGGRPALPVDGRLRGAPGPR